MIQEFVFVLPKNRKSEFYSLWELFRFFSFHKPFEPVEYKCYRDIIWLLLLLLFVPQMLRCGIEKVIQFYIMRYRSISFGQTASNEGSAEIAKGVSLMMWLAVVKGPRAVRDITAVRKRPQAASAVATAIQLRRTPRTMQKDDEGSSKVRRSSSRRFIQIFNPQLSSSICTLYNEYTPHWSGVHEGVTSDDGCLHFSICKPFKHLRLLMEFQNTNLKVTFNFFSNREKKKVPSISRLSLQQNSQRGNMKRNDENVLMNPRERNLRE